MEFDLNETQKLFKRSARELFAQECSAGIVRGMLEQGQPYSETLWSKLVEQGWTGLIIPEELGGMGLGMVELAVAFEEMGRALVPGAFLSTVALAGPLLAGTDPAGSARPHLTAICDGELKATVALPGEHMGWDDGVAGPQVAGHGEALTMNGRALFVPDAAASNLLIVAANDGSTPVVVLVDRDTAGVRVSDMRSMDASRALYEVVFEGVAIDRDRVVANGDQARALLSHAVDVATLAVSAEMVGGVEWILEASVEYAKTRKQFGKPIGQFQAVQHHCANMLLLCESARSAVYYAAWVMESDPAQAALAVSVAKAYASDAYRETGNLGIQVHGGVGFTWDESLHFYYKRAKASELLFGDATFHRERIARLIIDQAGEAR